MRGAEAPCDVGIIMSAPMIRALLDGRKTMTRRMAWREPTEKQTAADIRAGVHPHLRPTLWQRVKPGDRLWVRETWQTGNTDDGPRITFAASPDYFDIDAWDGPDEGVGPSFNYDKCPGATFETWLSDLLNGDEGRWRSPIHMPRWASRITLEVMATRIEPLQAIDWLDAIAEGVIAEGVAKDRPIVDLFRDLWKSLHGAGSWDANPDVVPISFKFHHHNIDRLNPNGDRE